MVNDWSDCHLWAGSFPPCRMAGHSRQRHTLGTAPEVFERVVGPRLGLEQMDHDVAVVEQNPAAFFVSFDSQPAVAHPIFQGVVDFLAHGVELAATGAGGEHEVVEHRGQLAHVEHDDVGAAIVFGGLGGQQCPLKTGWDCRGAAASDRTRLSFIRT